MYRKYFGLKDLPFRNTPDEDFFCGIADREEIIEALEYIATRRDALAKVTGEVGSGKTTLLRILAERLRKKGFKIVYVPTPRLSPEEILQFIAKDLGINVENITTKVDLYNELYKFLVKTYNESKGVVVLIDEAHLIPLDTLEEVRLLSNIETNKDKLITIILFGQTELDEMLDQPSARQLKSRISYSFVLNPLTCNQVYNYLNFRMQKAGYNGDEIFSSSIANYICKVTQGLPRLINITADKLLLSVYSRGGGRVEKKDIKVSLEKKMFSPYKIVFLISVVFGGFVVYFVYDNFVRGDQYITNFVDIFNSPLAYIDKDISSSIEDGMSKNVQTGFTKNQENSIGQQKTASYYLPWNPNSFVVILSTFPCYTGFYSDKIKRYIKNEMSDVYIYEFNKDGNRWCSFVKGGFKNIKETKKFIEALPSLIKRHHPYAVEAYKINRVYEQRQAKLYESK